MPAWPKTPYHTEVLNLASLALNYRYQSYKHDSVLAGRMLQYGCHYNPWKKKYQQNQNDEY